MSSVGKKMMQAAAGAGEPTGSYIAVAHSGSPYFTLLDHTTPGSLSRATAYNTGVERIAVAFSKSGDYIAAVGSSQLSAPAKPSFNLFDHTTPGSVSLAASYYLSGTGTGYSVAFSENDNYIAVAHSVSPYFTLLDHTTPGSVFLAATYTLFSTGDGVAFSKSGNYIAVGHQTSSPGSTSFVLLDHTTPGSVSLSATYSLSFSGKIPDFSPDDNYIVIPNQLSPNLTLLDHTTPGSVSLAATYTTFGDGVQAVFSPDGNYIAVGIGSSAVLTLLDHTTPGSLSLAATYNLAASGFGYGVSFSPDGLYLAATSSGSTGIPARVSLLDHSSPGSLSIAATYNLPDNGRGVAFSPN